VGTLRPRINEGMPCIRKGAHAWPSAIVAVPLVLILVVATAAASEIHIDSDPPGQRFSLLPPEQLALQDTATTPAAERAPLPSESERRPNWLLTSLLSSAAVVGGAANSLTDHCCQSYHFANEGWFGANTHYGGADKASHLTSYYIVSNEFAKLLVELGHKPENARWLAAGVAALTGLANEIADGLNRDGFSYQDFVMDIGGALTAALVDAAKAEDLVGFRRGFVNLNACCNYSNEIYTADLALVGVARRLRLDIGPFKYLLLSVTYRTQGYPSDPNRQRQVGVEVGLNFKQILDDLNVRRDKWWGYGLHVVFDNIRFPYTAGGYFYDLNHGRWHGPNAGF
jgi:Predicted periplasmic lipoprotein (DUF2279)